MVKGIQTRGTKRKKSKEAGNVLRCEGEDNNENLQSGEQKRGKKAKKLFVFGKSKERIGLCREELYTNTGRGGSGKDPNIGQVQEELIQ